MSSISKRYFMFGSLLTGALPLPSVASLKRLGYQSPNEKLNIASIGADGQPLGDMRQAKDENIVALADVDWRRAEQGFKTFEKARRYKDFRQMLDKEGKQIDAIVIGTPDHMHAYCALACIELEYPVPEGSGAVKEVAKCLEFAKRRWLEGAGFAKLNAAVGCLCST